MDKRNRKRLMASFAALILSAVAILTANQTLCRYLTTVEKRFSFAPQAKAVWVAVQKDDTITLAGEGKAYVYLHIPMDMKIESVTVNETPLKFVAEILEAGTAVHKTYGDGKIVLIVDEQGLVVFQNNDKLKITFPATTPETEAASESETTSATETTSEAGTSMDSIHVIIVPIHEKGGRLE